MSPKDPQSPYRRRDVLVGTWTFSGRTIGSMVDDVRGRVAIRWILDGYFQEQKSHIEFEGQTIEALEIVGYASATDEFPSTVFGAIEPGPSRFRWQVRGTDVLHAGRGATFHGRLSADGRTITGGWRPDPGTLQVLGSAYDVVMRKDAEELIG